MLNSRLGSNEEEEEERLAPTQECDGTGAISTRLKVVLVEKIFIERMTSDRKLKASREDSK